MNRIKISPLATESLSDVPGDSSNLKSLDRIADSSVHDVSVFVPMHYEKNYAYPLIVWLHSNTQTAEQIQSVMLEMSMRNYVGIAPQAPVGNQKTGYFWEQDFDSIELSHDAVVDSIEEATRRFNIAPHRIFLAGMDEGGTMAFRLAFERPDLFGGVLSVNGPLPTEHAPLSDWSKCREMPVFWAHGRRSEQFSEEQLCHQLKLLHIAGFSVTLRQYPQSNLLCEQTMSDMNSWIMEMISTAVSDR